MENDSKRRGNTQVTNKEEGNQISEVIGNAGNPEDEKRSHDAGTSRGHDVAMKSAGTQAYHEGGRQQRTRHSNESGSRLAIALVIVMYLCWTPLLIQITVRAALPSKPTSLYWIGFSETANIILFSNAFFNPFLIQRFNPQMKRAYNMCFSTRVHPINDQF